MEKRIHQTRIVTTIRLLRKDQAEVEMIKLMVFDVAGTTVSDADNAVAACVCAALEAAGIPTSLEAVNPVMGMPKPLAIRTLIEQHRGNQPTVVEVEEIHADFQSRMIEHYRTSPNITPMKGAEELFATLRERGIRIGLDTGFDRPIMNVILDRLNWHDKIDDSVTSDEVDNGRPAPDMIHALMAEAGVANPAEVGKVGDSVSDIEQGLTAECGLVVAVLGERTRPVIGNYPGVHGITELSEILPLLDHQTAEIRG
jgi:phosphonatase-like hydrolase